MTATLRRTISDAVTSPPAKAETNSARDSQAATKARPAPDFCASPSALARPTTGGGTQAATKTRSDSGVEASPPAIEESQSKAVTQAATFDDVASEGEALLATIEAAQDGRRIDDESRNEIALIPADFRLDLAAATLDDLERLRIALRNRLDAMERNGLGDSSFTAHYHALAEIIAGAEHDAELELKRALRKHPLGDWVRRTVGVGEKQGARLIAAIGDPYWNHAEDRPRRGPAELWAYCGFRPGQRRRKGERSNWNATAKMRAFLVAESCIKHAASPYRARYDAARLNWDGRDVRPAHAHAHGLRVVAKAMLKDLWIAAREVHS
jgi:hypothetical protein